MNRIAVFVVLFVVFSVWHFPHRRLVEAALAPQVARAGLVLSIEEVRYGFPMAYVLSNVQLDGLSNGANLDQVRVGFGFGSYDIDAEACGGTIRGLVGEDKIELTFAGVDPAVCLRQGDLVVAGKFTGTLNLDGPGQGRGNGAIGKMAEAARLSLNGRAGTLSGSIAGTAAKPGQPRTSIGSWEFEEVSTEARLEGDQLVFTKGSASSQGIQWQLIKGRVFSAAGGRTRLAAELRARNADGSNRAKAVLGLLPKAGTGRDGWRRYKVSGDLTAPTIVGLR